MKSKQDILDFIKAQKVGFIASVDGEGFPNMKAMLAPRVVEESGIYFSTNTSSMRVAQYEANEKASVYFYNKGRFKYEGVMLIGTMKVRTDSAAKELIWRTGDTMFYKKGVTDPDYCVLQFVPCKCRYYCNLKTVNIDW